MGFFSWFSKKKVQPSPPQSASIPKYDDLFEKNTAFIMIQGVGSTCNNDLCVMDVPNENIFYKLDYKSRGVVSDFIQARYDATCKDGSCEHRIGTAREHTRERLNNLTNIIVACLNNNHQIKKVVVIGCSHGSLIVHGAFLRVQMMVDNSKIAEKLFIFTIGSPHYLPKDLVPTISSLTHPKLLNAYHVDDPIINLLGSKLIPEWVFPRQIPVLQGVTISEPYQMTEPAEFKAESEGKYYYDTSTSTLVVSGNYHIEAFFSHYKIEEFQGRAAQDIIKYKRKHLTSLSSAYHHVTPYILLPLFSSDKHLYTLKFVDTTRKFANCVGQIGGARKDKKVIRLTETNKVYTVYVNNEGKTYIKTRGKRGENTKTIMLSSIRGKYRYVRQDD